MYRCPVPTVLAALAASLLAAAPATALTEWGAVARTSTFDCISSCTNADFGPSTGGKNQTSASSDIDDSKGEAHALSSFDPATLSTPELRASAFGHDNVGDLGSAFATTFVVQGYTNEGAASVTFDLDITLEADAFDDTPLDMDTNVTAELIVWEAPGFCFSEDPGTIEFECGSSRIDDVDLVIVGDDVNDHVKVVVTGSVAFTLMPGESVYVWAKMRAEAQRDETFADAFGTLSMEFNNTPEELAGLVAAAVVPEPAVLPLLGLAAFGLRRILGRS